MNKRKFLSRGQALVEFALVLPLYCMFILGAFEVGSIIFQNSILQIVATEAVQAGTRQNDLSRIEAAAKAQSEKTLDFFFKKGSRKFNSVEVTVTISSDLEQDPVQVGVTMPYQSDMRDFFRQLLNLELPFQHNVTASSYYHRPLLSQLSGGTDNTGGGLSGVTEGTSAI